MTVARQGLDDRNMESCAYSSACTADSPCICGQIVKNFIASGGFRLISVPETLRRKSMPAATGGTEAVDFQSSR